MTDPAGQFAGQLGGQATSAAKSSATSGAGSGMKKAAGSRTFWYCFLTLLISAGCGTLSLICENDLERIFLATQVIFFVFGILHVLLMYNLFTWSGKYNFQSELLFSLLVMLLMYIGFTVTFFILNKSFAFVFSSALITFIVPLLIHWTFNYSISIPPKDYKKWIYPDKPIVSDMENMDLSNFAVITFVFSKKFGDSALSNFQSKAPYSIRLGDLFYFFVQEWNYKNPGNTIEFNAEEKEPFGWYFYIKKSWWKPMEYLDADLTVKENKISVNAVIITKRVTLQDTK